MADYMQTIFGEAQQIQSTITSQHKLADEAVQKIRSTIQVNITPGIFEGSGAEAFSQFILTKYIPDFMALIAAVAGISTGLGQGLDMFSKADTSAFGQVQGIADQFNFF